MGGTFDPVHTGHLFIAEAAREAFELDRVIFIPTGYPPHKEACSLTSGQQRINMLQLAVRDHPLFQVSEIEVKRKGTTYTVDTLTELKAVYRRDHLFFIIGGDTLPELRTWRNFEKVAGLCSFIVYHRPGYDRTDLEQEAQRLKDTYKADIHFIEGPYLEISSSGIRKRLAENKTIRYLVPDGVVKYILEHKLYKGE